MKFIDKIFFYGSLKSDGPFYNLYSRNIITTHNAYIYGKLAMYKNIFPALVEDSKSKVYGEVVTVFNVTKVLTILDNIEKYLERAVKDVFLLNEENNVTKTVAAWVYIYKDNRQYLEFINTNNWLNKNLQI